MWGTWVIMGCFLVPCRVCRSVAGAFLPSDLQLRKVKGLPPLTQANGPIHPGTVDPLAFTVSKELTKWRARLEHPTWSAKGCPKRPLQNRGWKLSGGIRRTRPGHARRLSGRVSEMCGKCKPWPRQAGRGGPERGPLLPRSCWRSNGEFAIGECPGISR